MRPYHNGVHMETLKDNKFASFVEDLAMKSGEIITSYFRDGSFGVELKNDSSPVTRADREAEALMRKMIRKAYPGHGIIGEEYGTENESAEYVWVLDPIDGTVSFVHGCPLFGTLIGLLREGWPLLGAIHIPVLNQLCIGDNETCTVNGRSVRVREIEEISEALLLTTNIASIAEYQSPEGFDTLLAETRLFRTWGDCYGYLLVASGKADIMLDPVMHPWDLLPLVPIIRGAGGIISTWSGEEPTTGTSCVAANRVLHRKVIRTLSS
jgi:histidinol phosphatase-like enzyme (inositol monophosphatase family)